MKNFNPSDYRIDGPGITVTSVAPYVIDWIGTLISAAETIASDTVAESESPF